MSDKPSGLKKNPREKSHSQKNPPARLPKDKPEVDSRKNGEKTVTKRTSSQLSTKPVPGTKISTPKSEKSSQEVMPTSSKKVQRKPMVDPEKRGVSSVYVPRQSSRKALQEIPKPPKKSDFKRLPSRERRKSRTLSPSEVKVLNKNYVRSSKPQESSSEYEYEDDFEDYESDFQECTDSEASQVSDESQAPEDPELQPVVLMSKEPSKPLPQPLKPREPEEALDSGHYDLEEARRRAARMTLMSSRSRLAHSTQPSIFPEEKPSEIRSLPSSADEGFEDGRSGDFKSPPLPGSHDLLKDISRKLAAKPKPLSRGKKLLQMIKLDVIEWSIYESTPINYEEFIGLHGRINTRQIATQTREDDLSVETQTEKIEMRAVWTQHPVVCRRNLRSHSDIQEFERELLGVGHEGEDSQVRRPVYDFLALNDFLERAGSVVLALLEEQLARRALEEDAAGEMPFSESTIRLKASRVNFLEGRPVMMVRYAGSRVLLSIHASADEDVRDIEMSGQSQMADCCVGCQWNIQEPSRPIKMFYSGSDVTALVVHPGNCNVVVGGLEDGSLSLWDLEEDEMYHPKIQGLDNLEQWALRSPTFTTVDAFEDVGEVEEKPSKIVALKILDHFVKDEKEYSRKFVPIQICSLDEAGNCTIWSVLRSLDTATPSISQQLGQCWWGKTRLVKSHKVSLAHGKITKNIIGDDCMTAFRDLSLDSIDTNNLFIANNTSKVLHATRTGKRRNPLFYDGDSMGYSATTCIESCPFDQPYFFAGFTDGTLRLFSSTTEKPLVHLKNLNSTAPIKIIQWSRSKPFTIYVLNDQSEIHVWDLSRSDIFPLHSISPKKPRRIGTMELSPCRSDYDMANQYLALGLEDGTIEIHKFNEEFHYSNEASRTAELNTFLHYVEVS